MTAKQKADQVRARLQDIGHAVDERLPEGYGFIVMAFPFGEGHDNHLQYVSNAKREDAIRTLKEWLIKCSAAEDWMKDIR